MATIGSIRNAARNAKNRQYPFIDNLKHEDKQRLMNMTGIPNRSGHIYTVIVSQGKRALRYDGV